MENDKKKNKCQLLYITYEYGEHIDGGIGRVINGISSNLKNEIQFDIFHLHFNFLRKKWIGTLYETDKTDCKKKFTQEYIRSLIRTLEEKHYDIVHILHFETEIAGCISVIKTRFPFIKVIYSCHAIAKYEIPIRNNYPVDLVNEKYIISNIDHIHFLNITSQNYFNQTYPLNVKQMPFSIIPNGIDEISFKQKDVHFEKKLRKKIGSKENSIVLCMSRWSYGKGIEYLLDAVAGVVRNVKNIRFIIAGRKSVSWENGYGNYTKMIDQRIAVNNKYVIPLNWLNSRKRNSLFCCADILVMPSLLEYFPYSILEPLINKIPIISSRIDSVTEMLDENRDCLFFEPGNSDNLADQIVKLIDNQDLQKQLTDNGYRKAKEMWQWDSIIQMYMNMYCTVLKMDSCPDKKAVL